MTLRRTVGFAILPRTWGRMRGTGIPRRSRRAKWVARLGRSQPIQPRRLRTPLVATTDLLPLGVASAAATDLAVAAAAGQGVAVGVGAEASSRVAAASGVATGTGTDMSARGGTVPGAAVAVFPGATGAAFSFFGVGGGGGGGAASPGGFAAPGGGGGNPPSPRSLTT